MFGKKKKLEITKVEIIEVPLELFLVMLGVGVIIIFGGLLKLGIIKLW